MLVGREKECAVIDRLLDGLREGRSAALVVRGEAGIGKSALLDYAAEAGAGMTVLRAVGVESEAELEFSGLLEVLRPLAGQIGDLPKPQADGLRSALGISPGGPIDRFVIGAATLSLLATAAERAPVLLLVDDAHWLDRSSADALLFAVRRFEADAIGTLLTLREGESPVLGTLELPELELEGLEPVASQQLLASRVAVDVAPEVATRIHAATGGNPLALIELPTVLTPEQLSGREPLEDPLPTGATIPRLFAARLAALPGDTQRALLIAAVSGPAELEPVLAALDLVGLDPSAFEPAEDAGLIRIANARLYFRHPLMRSAIFHAAPPSERRAVHRVYAQALTHERSSEERAWHLAAASVGPDENVAAALAQAAERARERSGYAGAAAALERAATLTPDETVRQQRLHAAAEAAWLSGRSDRAIALLEEALEACEEPALRGRMLHLRGHIEHLAGRVMVAYETLMGAAALPGRLGRSARPARRPSRRFPPMAAARSRRSEHAASTPTGTSSSQAVSASETRAGRSSTTAWSSPSTTGPAASAAKHPGSATASTATSPSPS